MAEKKNPFDFVNAINKGIDIVNNDQHPEEAIKGYVPFITNRALSYHYDALAVAQMMNLAHFLDPKLQYDFLINTLRPRARYGKWAKAADTKDVELVARYYGCSKETARTYMPLVTPAQLDIMKTSMQEGGDNGK